MRTVIYARKSTESDDRQAQSLEDQLKAMKEIARNEGHAVVETFIESRSAKKPGTRPEFERMVSMIEVGEAEAILTWAPNRLSRNPVDGGKIAYLLQEKKLSLIRTHDRTYRPEDSSLLLAIENAMATDYSRNLTNDVARGMRGKVDRGWHACKAPLGYMTDPDTRATIPDPARFALVREGWDLMLTGRYSVRDVHRILVAKGLTARFRRREIATPVSDTRLYELFRSRTYLGEVPYKGQHYPGRHTPMVTEAEFDQVQEFLGNAGRPKKKESKRFPFSGVFRCAVCGCAIVGETKKKYYPQSRRTAVYTYYHCTGSKGCTKKAVRQEDLVALAERTVSGLKMSKGTAIWLTQAIMASFERDATETAEGIVSLERRSAQEEGRLRRLAEMRLDNEFGSAEYADLKRGILERQAELREKIHLARDLAGKVLRQISKKLEACVAAGEIENLDRDPNILAKVLRIGGTSLLNLSDLDFRLDPILTKIATFEPLRKGSEKLESSDSLPLNSEWWTFAEELRNLATEEAVCEEARDRARTHQDKRWDRNYGHGL